MNNRGAYQKKARNIANIRARYELLVNGIKTPASLSKAVLPFLAGQRAFASLDLPNLNISPIALNTLKSLAGELYSEADGNGNKGFAHLNFLRVELRKALEVNGARRSKVAKADRTKGELTDTLTKLQAAELQSILQSKAYFDLYSKINTLVKEGALEEATRLRLYNLLSSHHATFEHLFTPGHASNNDSGAVVPFRHKQGQ